MRTIFFITLMLCSINAYCDEWICYVDKATGKISDITVYTQNNEQTLKNKVTADKEVKKITADNSFVSTTNYIKWDGSKVVEDIATKTAIEYETSIKEKVEVKQKIMAIDELLKTSIGDEATELLKQKAELESKL